MEADRTDAAANRDALDMILHCADEVYQYNGDEPYFAAEEIEAARSQLAAIRAERDAMREALGAVHDWRGLCDANANETFERIAEMFHRDTGYLRPGKDSVLHDPEERQAAWSPWVKRKNDELDALIRAALAPRTEATAHVPPEREQGGQT